jgi:hypothetical protein
MPLEPTSFAAAALLHSHENIRRWHIEVNSPKIFF